MSSLADPIAGVLAPVVTPFNADGKPDADRFVQHCRWLLAEGVGLAVFGTNSEGTSLAVEEKEALLNALVGAGLDPGRMMPGTGHCAIPDTTRLTADAVRLGCAGVLMLPPFYYKDVVEDGLFGSVADVIEAVGDARLRVYLYHIPQVSYVPITGSLIERLLKAYPDTIAGLKDSSGDWQHTRGMLDRFAGARFDIFTGSERFLLDALRHGGAGCISATANVNPASIARLYQTWRSETADAQQRQLTAIRDLFVPYPMIPALKAAVAHFRGDEGWAAVRPPLVALSAGQRRQLVSDLEAHGFAMNTEASHEPAH